MIRNEHVATPLFQQLEPFFTQSCGSSADDVVNGTQHDFVLKFVGALYGQEFLAEIFRHTFGKEIPDNVVEKRMIGHALYRSRNLIIVIWAGLFEQIILELRMEK